MSTSASSYSTNRASVSSHLEKDLCLKRQKSLYKDFCLKNGSSQGHNLALTVLYVPSSLDSGDNRAWVTSLARTSSYSTNKAIQSTPRAVQSTSRTMPVRFSRPCPAIPRTKSVVCRQLHEQSPSGGWSCVSTGSSFYK